MFQYIAKSRVEQKMSIEQFAIYSMRVSNSQIWHHQQILGESCYTNCGIMVIALNRLAAVTSFIKRNHFGIEMEGKVRTRERLGEKENSEHCPGPLFPIRRRSKRLFFNESCLKLESPRFGVRKRKGNGARREFTNQWICRPFDVCTIGAVGYWSMAGWLTVGTSRESAECRITIEPMSQESHGENLHFRDNQKRKIPFQLLVTISKTFRSKHWRSLEAKRENTVRTMRAYFDRSQWKSLRRETRLKEYFVRDWMYTV
jgi:hypothetical protein